MFKKNYFKILMLTLVLALFVTGCSSNKDKKADTKDVKTTEDVAKDKDAKKEEPVPLLVYAGAGLKRAMEEIKPAFEAKENVKIEYIFAGSGQLLAQMETSGKGDVFIVGSEDTYKVAKDKGLANKSQLVAHHTPALAVQKGNPKGIKSLKDLTKDGIKVALGDAKANAIGKTAQEIIKKNGLEGINKNVVATTATVNELVTIISTGQADVAIVTEDSVRFSKDVEMVEIPAEENIDQLIPVGTLTSSKHQELAQKLSDFIASDEGKAIFEKNGYKILK